MRLCDSLCVYLKLIPSEVCVCADVCECTVVYEGFIWQFSPLLMSNFYFIFIVNGNKIGGFLSRLTRVFMQHDTHTVVQDVKKFMEDLITECSEKPHWYGNLRTEQSILT